MKTAKEMCEDIEKEKLEFWINSIQGKRSMFFGNEPGELKLNPQKSSCGKDNLYYEITQPSELVLKELIKLGYKVEKKSGVFPVKIIKRLFKSDEIEFKEFSWVEISACCGEENEA